MGVIESKGPNLNETDRNDPRFTEASQSHLRYDMTGLISNMDTYLGRGFEAIHAVDKMSADQVQPEDEVVIGNRKGVVVAVQTGVDKNGKTTVLAITVNEDMRYLPQDYKGVPETFGYDDDDSNRNRTVTYNLVKEGDAVSLTSDNEVSNQGGGQQVFYTGSILVNQKRTTDRSTWTKTADDAATYQDKFVTT